MAKLKMVRIDYRLIHGQVVAKWIKFRPVERLILVDDALAADEFMADIYRMAAGDKQVDIVGMADAQKALDATDDTTMLIFKDVATAYSAWQSGVALPELNIGAVPSAKDRKTVVQGVALSPAEYGQLNEIAQSGVHVYLQPIPEHEAVSLDSVAGKVN